MKGTRNDSGELLAEGPAPQPQDSDDVGEYVIEKFDCPDTVGSGENFTIDATVCCVGDDQCPTSEFVVEKYRVIEGPAGLWPFPAANKASQKLTSEELRNDDWALIPTCINGFCDVDLSIDEPGTYEFRLTIDTKEATTRTTVE